MTVSPTVGRPAASTRKVATIGGRSTSRGRPSRAATAGRPAASQRRRVGQDEPLRTTAALELDERQLADDAVAAQRNR